MKPFNLRLLSVIIPTLFSFSSFALVDYTDEQAAPTNNKTPYEKVRNTPAQRVKSNAPRKSGVGKFLNMGFKYDSLAVNQGESQGDVGRIHFDGRFLSCNREL